MLNDTFLWFSNTVLLVWWTEINDYYGSRKWQWKKVGIKAVTGQFYELETYWNAARKIQFSLTLITVFAHQKYIYKKWLELWPNIQKLSKPFTVLKMKCFPFIKPIWRGIIYLTKENVLEEINTLHEIVNEIIQRANSITLWYILCLTEV